MALADADLRQLIVTLLREPTKRTKQVKIGASGIGDPCPYCLAGKLLAHKQKPSKYWLGARLGDAVHALLEREAGKHLQDTLGPWKAFRNASLEETIYIGTIPGYGDIYSTPDLYLSTEKHLVDYKTSKRSKVDYYMATDIPTQYKYQAQLYARALEDAGKPVEKISFVFINRDGVSERDINVFSIDYDRALADEAWDRVVSAWEWLQAGGEQDSLPSDPDCFYCNVVLHRI